MAQGSETINLEEEDVEEDKYSSTPLKKYVTFIGDKKAYKWTCNLNCKPEPYTGSYSRIRAHFIGLSAGQKSQGIAVCSKVNKENREKMKREEEEAQRIPTRKLPSQGIPFVPPATGKPSSSSVVSAMFNLSSRKDVDGVVGLFFYGCGIPFNAARSPFFTDMIRAVNEAPKGYTAPGSEKIRTILLDKEKAKVDCALMGLKDQWPQCGVSVVSDGWTNIKNCPLINVMAISGGRAMFLNGIDCSGDEKTGLFIAELLLKSIESIGVYNVVQVLTDNASACKRAGDIIMDIHPHILWSGCMAHTLSLLMKDIAHSKHHDLVFIEKVYAKAKGVVTYLKTHSMVAFIFKKFSSLEVIQVKKTRFGHHYIVLERMLRVKNALISLVLSEDWDKIKSGTSKSRLEHIDVKKCILDDNFWQELKFILKFTKPNWEMIRFCDSDKAVIGEVYQKMEDMLAYIEIELSHRSEMCEFVSDLVMKRWGKMNIPLHLIAYVLTPYFYSDAWLKSVGPKGTRRIKPHQDSSVQQVYLDVVDRLLRNSSEGSIVRKQLSDFVCHTGSFARPQSIQDRKLMSAVQWWNLHGSGARDLCALATKVLSQSVNTSCAERAWSTYGFIHSVKRNRMNTSWAESLVYVHYNHRLLTRYREDYEKSFKNWDAYVEDDSLDVDMAEIAEKEYDIIFGDTSAAAAAPAPPENEAEHVGNKRHRST